MPDPTQEQQIKEANGLAGEAPKVTADEYIQKRHEQKKEKRGGVQVRIDKLTKEAAESRRLAEEMKAKLTAIEETTRVKQNATGGTGKITDGAVASGDGSKPDPRPKREDFQDETSHTTAIAEWVVRQQNKIIAKAPEAKEAPKETVYDEKNPEHVRIKAEFDREFPAFREAGQAFIKDKPDFTDRLNAAAAKGLTLDNLAQRAIIKLKSPQVLYYLADPANEAEARALMTMDPVNQVVQIGLIHDRLQVKPQDYVSNAPKPGRPLTNGSSYVTIPRDKMETDDYIAMRIQEKKARYRH